MTPRLIYILGAGRSGSTLVDRLLGSAPRAAGMGELHILWRAPLRSLTCSCGAPAPECGFWTEALARAGIGDSALAELNALEHGVIRHKRILAEAARGRAFAAGAEVRRFLDIQAALFGALAETAGADTIIDSSKAGPRAWALAGWPETRILHLRRDPADVVAAWRREKADPSLGGPMRRPSVLAAAKDWLVAEASAARLARLRPVARLDYDDFVAAPRRRIGDLGFAPEGIAWTGIDTFRPDPDYHALNGNPDRFRRGEIAIEPPPRPAIRRRDRAAARVIGAALEKVAP